MKIETTIIPRKDGKVSAKAPSGAQIVFLLDEQGRLVADVAKESDAAWLLSLPDFMPADEADIAAAALLSTPPEADDDGIDDGSQVGEVEDLDDDEPADLDAAPIEAPTPIDSARKGKKK